MSSTAHGHEETPTGNRFAVLLRRILPERLRPIGYLTHLVRTRTYQRVRRGPFAGMRYVDCSIGSAYLPKLLGTYERELGPVIEAACADHLELIVDVGAAEGYYAVGLALRNPLARVIAFESQQAGRTALRQMAELNGVAHRIAIRGCCQAADLEAALNSGKDDLLRGAGSSSLLVCDVEGDEEALLDPQVVPRLRTTQILAEMHEFVRPGITDQLRDRFARTHRVEQIWQTPRSWHEFPFRNPGTRMLPRSYLDWAVSEWRPMRMSWLWMKPHA